MLARPCRLPFQVQCQKLLQMVVILGLGGTLVIGFQFSVIPYPSQSIRRFINETWLARHGAALPQNTLTFLWSLIVSFYCLGGLVGCLWTSTLVRRYGKKKLLMGNDVIIMAAALLLGFSRMANSFEMIIMGRFIYGFGAGIALNIQGPILSETSPERFRGFAASTTSVFLSLGKALGQILGLRELLGAEALWPLLLAFCGFPALLQLLLLPFLPDSPSALLTRKDHPDKGFRAVKSLRGDVPHQAEVEEATKEKMATKTSADLSILEVIKDQSLWWPMTISALLLLSLQFSGLNAIYFYAFEVFRTANIEERLLPYTVLGIGLCELASTALCSFMVDAFGRKILLWGGYSLMALTMTFLVVTLSLQHYYPWLSYGSISLIFLITLFFGLGPAGASIAIMMELFSHSARSSAVAVASSVSWLGLLILGMVFPFVVEALSHYCFLIFLALLTGMVIFFYNYIPETKGRSLTEIREELERLRSGKKLTSIPKENHSFRTHSLCTKL